MQHPFISICIPAYRRPENIRRLLQSVSEQAYGNYEIIVTDDSPDDSVAAVCEAFSELPLSYHKNAPSKGTPANWNSAIEKARGEWIKVMHDDDWFATPDALDKFALAATENIPFIFCSYANHFPGGHTELKKFPARRGKEIIEKPMLLLSENIIGPPSVIMTHRSVAERYDERLKWRVDMEYYVRLLHQHRSFYHIPYTLVNVGVSASQVTNDCLNVASVELPEGLILLKKHGLQPLKDIRIYDAWWRILRNVNVRSIADLHQHTPGESWPGAIETMVRHQMKVPQKLLKKGVFSKLSMGLSFIANKSNLRS